MPARSFWVAIAVALAACEPGEPALRPCTADAECGAEACLDGVCAPALEDPGGPALTPGSPLRVHAVGLHPTLADVETQAAWRDFVRARFARDVVPALASDRPNLIVLPENTTLTTAFIGARGETGRSATSTMVALGNVLGSHLDAIAFYNERLSSEIPIGRLLGLVVTDTVWRAIEPFRELAREHRAWIALTGDFPIAARTDDPRAIAALVDEAETDRSFAWVADLTHEVHNQTLLISPEGEIVHSFRKAYLVPIEEMGLDLDYGRAEDLRAFDLPLGPGRTARIASVISKDAWMPDVIDRLALDGAALMLQPEAFSGWGIPHGEEGAWAPDVVRESGWVQVMRYPELQANVMPCWNGNLFELVFDCQSSILVQARHEATRGAWIGQDEAIGYARVAPWAIEDDGAGSIEARRARLTAHGERLAPGSGDPLENAYADGGVWMDLDLSRGWPVRDPAPEEIAAAPSDGGEQRRPALVATREGFLVLWEDTRRGLTRLYGALGRLEGDSIAIGEARVRVETTGEPRRPRLAARGDVAYLVWQENHDDRHPSALYARSRDGGRSFSSGIALGSDPDAPQWTPDVAIAPDGQAWAAWIDRSGVGARVWAGPARPAHPHEGAGSPILPVELPYTPRANQHLPAIAFGPEGHAIVAWTDFRNARWEIFAARRERAGWSEPFRVDDADVPFETLHSDPRLAVAGDRVIAAWTDLRERRASHDVRARALEGGAPSIELDATGDDQRPAWRPAIAARGDRVIVVWQDTRDERSSLRYAISDDGGASFAPDTPLFSTDDRVDRYNPEVVWLDDRHALVAYESTATGARRIALRLWTP